MEEKNITIHQDPKILQQILKAIPGDLNNHINIVMIGQINGQSEVFDLMSFLETLPVPRLKSLRNEAIRVTKEHFLTIVEVAKFLGFERSNLYPNYHKGGKYEKI